MSSLIELLSNNATALAVGLFAVAAAVSGDVFGQPISSDLMSFGLLIVGFLIFTLAFSSTRDFAYKRGNYTLTGKELSGYANILAVLLIGFLALFAVLERTTTPDRFDAIETALGDYIESLNNAGVNEKDLRLAQYKIFANCQNIEGISMQARRIFTEAVCADLLGQGVSRESAHKALASLQSVK